MGIFSTVYDKVIICAGKRQATSYLAAVSFAEASFSPVPTDIMLAPMVLANPIKAFSYARIAIFFSVFGGIFGYLFGYFAFHPIVEPLIKTFGYESTYYKIVELFQIWGFGLLCLVGCIPLPYKLFTLSAGMLQYNIVLFIMASIIGRSLRYFLVSTIIKAGGKKMDILLRRFIDRAGWVTIVVILMGIVMMNTGCSTQQQPAEVISLPAYKRVIGIAKTPVAKISRVNTAKNMPISKFNGVVLQDRIIKPIASVVDQEPARQNIVNTVAVTEEKPVLAKVNTAAVPIPLHCIWPAKGPILSRFLKGTAKKNGLNISGSEGAAIQAIAAGKVVYSGSGLRGYGNLIIIKHENNFLSAYAHNKVNIVKEGAEVRLGQQIAEMGSTGTNKVMLHFELRHYGTPIDPEQILPKQ